MENLRLYHTMSVVKEDGKPRIHQTAYFATSFQDAEDQIKEFVSKKGLDLVAISYVEKSEIEDMGKLNHGLRKQYAAKLKASL